MSRRIFANVGRGRPRRQRRAFRRIFRRLVERGRHRGAIVSYAEIGEADRGVNEPRRLRRVFRAIWWRRVGVKRRCPVVIGRLWWRVEDVETIRVVRGVAGAWPGRFLVVVRHRRRFGRRRNRHPEATVNTHFVPGAFNGKRDRHEKARDRAWEQHWGGLVDVVSELRDDEGRDVTVTADVNRQGRFAHPHPAAVLAHVNATDRIYAVPAPGREAVVKGKGALLLGIDFHRAIYANVSYREAGR